MMGEPWAPEERCYRERTGLSRIHFHCGSGAYRAATGAPQVLAHMGMQLGDVGHMLCVICGVNDVPVAQSRGGGAVIQGVRRHILRVRGTPAD